MKLRNMTLLTLIMMVFMFITQITAILFPSISTETSGTTYHLIKDFAAHLILLGFFLLVIKEFIPDDSVSFYNSAITVSIATIALMIIGILKNLSNFFPNSEFSGDTGIYLTVTIHWVFSYILIIFLLHLFMHFKNNNLSTSKKAVRPALLGSILLFCLHSLDILNYFYLRETNTLFWDFSFAKYPAPAILLLLLIYISFFFFLNSFRTDLKKN
jgi:hypothetical protein